MNDLRDVPGAKKDPLQRRLPAALAITALVFVVYHPILKFGFLGQDTFLILVTSAIHTPQDAFRIFTDELMGGRFRSAFYRPVLNLSFATDYALWGLDPFGYQLTTLLCMAACAVMLFLFTARLAGSRARLVPWLAAAVFVLYPAHYEVLPVPARRADVLCCFFSLLALHLQLAPRALAARRPVWLAGLFALFALGSKETGLVLAPLAFASAWLFGPRGDTAGRIRAALTSAVPFLIALGIAGVARLAAIGSLGGHADAGFANLGQVFVLGRSLVFPQPFMLHGAYSGVLYALNLAALCIVSVQCIQGGDAPARTDPRLARAGVFAGVWIASTLLLHAYAGKGHPWYLFFPAVGWAMGAGILIDGLWALRRASAGFAILFLALLLCWQARFAPVFHTYVAWTEADAALSQYIGETVKILRAARPGDVLKGGVFPSGYDPPSPPRGPEIRGASILRKSSIQAFAELAFPGLKVRVLDPYEARSLRMAPDAVTLIVSGGRRLGGNAKEP